MKVQLLVSTMHQNDYSLIKKMNIITDAIIINQCDKFETNEIKIDDKYIKFISYDERGLSLSRNRALQNSSGDICILSDDDMVYDDDYEKKILDAYEKYSDVDIIAFQVLRTKNNKRFDNKVKNINYLNSMSISSVEITFKRKSIIDKGIKFNNLFGTGSKYFMGEENIFLYDCLKKGLKIIYVPEKIAVVDNEESSWFRGFNKDYFITKGACYYEMSKKWYLGNILQFAIRKRKLFENNINSISAISYMLEGVKKYKMDLER